MKKFSKTILAFILAVSSITMPNVASANDKNFCEMHILGFGIANYARQKGESISEVKAFMTKIIDKELSKTFTEGTTEDDKARVGLYFTIEFIKYADDAFEQPIIADVSERKNKSYSRQSEMLPEQCIKLSKL